MKIKKILNACSTFIVSIVLVIALLLVGVKFLGVDVYIVLSGSMEPKYPTGSVIYVKDVDVDELKAGDVITYQLNNSVVATHRIVEVVNENNQIAFKTKGDANDHVDNGVVNANQVIGSPFFAIPFLGYLASYIQSPSGMYVAIAFAVAMLAFMLLLEINRDDKK